MAISIYKYIIPALLGGVYEGDWRDNRVHSGGKMSYSDGATPTPDHCLK